MKGDADLLMRERRVRLLRYLIHHETRPDHLARLVETLRRLTTQFGDTRASGRLMRLTPARTSLKRVSAGDRR